MLVRGANGEDAGNIRHVNVKVAMTDEDYVPPILDSDTTKRQFATIINRTESWTMKAINLMLVISKMQWFLDGNKRTGLIAANALLYQHNAGILTIPDSKFHWYMSYLKKYYATGNVAIKNWLYDNAIFGM
ncbi:Fic family protein [Lacticaseibacillus pabuli]|uniref:Fic family protein n=1 Tax=Lacticaseibacillus pabuli TaxID=3025672 RepID=A0ABY7WQ80_9LACO|nr:Fic family protein [Lacticaseibacillus sp. KACC 23028]WDF82350.1 Fic family protein [Lacticaseibacillus sp. KACC 23028]